MTMIVIVIIMIVIVVIIVVVVYIVIVVLVAIDSISDLYWSNILFAIAAILLPSHEKQLTCLSVSLKIL